MSVCKRKSYGRHKINSKTPVDFVTAKDFETEHLLEKATQIKRRIEYPKLLLTRNFQYQQHGVIWITLNYILNDEFVRWIFVIVVNLLVYANDVSLQIRLYARFVGTPLESALELRVLSTVIQFMVV